MQKVKALSSFLSSNTSRKLCLQVLVVQVNVFPSGFWAAKVTPWVMVVVRLDHMVKVVGKGCPQKTVKDRNKKIWSIRVA